MNQLKPCHESGYPVDIKLPLMSATWGPLEAARPCPICGQRWQPCAGSRLPCHVKCLFTDLGLARLVLDEQATIEAHARRIGVTPATVRIAYRRALPRRAELAAADLLKVSA